MARRASSVLAKSLDTLRGIRRDIVGEDKHRSLGTPETFDILPMPVTVEPLLHGPSLHGNNWLWLYHVAREYDVCNGSKRCGESSSQGPLSSRMV